MAHQYLTIISTDQLRSIVEQETEVVIVDCRFSLADPSAGQAAYEQGHIPGALYANLDLDLASPVRSDSGRHPLPDATQFISSLDRWGVKPGCQVVVYDHGNGAMAARLWWMLQWIGHSPAALLSGGFAAWTSSSGAISQKPLTPARVGKPSEHYVANDSLWLTTNEVVQLSESIDLLDARSEPRFSGRHEPIDPVAGHIPHAVCMPFEQNVDQSGLFLSPEKLRNRFRACGITSNAQGNYSHVVHMCGSGVTACHNLLAMESAGMRGSKLYVGSWSEWIRDPARKIATE